MYIITILATQNSELECVMVFKIVSHVHFRTETKVMSSAWDILGNSLTELL